MEGGTLAFRRAFEAVHQLTDPAPPWADILATAREMVGAESASLIVFDQNRKLIHLSESGFTEQCSRDYSSYFFSRDVLEQDARSRRPGVWLDTAEIYSRTELGRTEFYADFMVKHHMDQILSLVIESGPHCHAAIGFQRSTVDPEGKYRLTTGEYSKYFKILKSQLVHRQKANVIGLQAVESAFSSFSEAIFLLSGPATVISMSPLAAENLGDSNGFSVCSGKLQHPDRSVQSLFCANCMQTLSDGRRRGMAVTIGWGNVLVIDIVLAPARLCWFGDSLVLVRMHRESAFSSLDVERLITAFRITRAEAEVLSSLCAGHSVKEIATLRNASVATIRKQVATLMVKMDCCRQAELVRLASLI